MEMRILAEVSKDSALIQLFNRDRDLHSSLNTLNSRCAFILLPISASAVLSAPLVVAAAFYAHTCVPCVVLRSDGRSSSKPAAPLSMPLSLTVCVCGGAMAGVPSLTQLPWRRATCTS
jgi:hypothetical protein